MTPLQELTRLESLEAMTDFLSIDATALVPRHRRIPLLRMFNQELGKLNSTASMVQLRTAFLCAVQRLQSGQIIEPTLHCDRCKLDCGQSQIPRENPPC